MREVLIRAIGPSLAQFGINDFAPNPSYTISNITPPNTSPLLLPGGAGQAWAATSAAGATILAEGQRAGAFPLVENSNDKADVVLLSPGAYTITVNPTSADGEGTELIEVYEVE